MELTHEALAARLAQSGLSLLDATTATAAARAGRLWAVDTQSRGADSFVDAADEAEAVGIVAHHEEVTGKGWTAKRVRLVRVCGECGKHYDFDDDEEAGVCSKACTDDARAGDRYERGLRAAEEWNARRIERRLSQVSR